MAGDTFFIQNRLDFMYEAEPPFLAVKRLDGLRCLECRNSLSGFDDGVAFFMAADAGDILAWHGSEPASHDLKGSAVFIQR